MATTTLAQGYRLCAVTTRKEARNFYYAFLSLPKPQRRAVYALYAFCREVDDVVDAVNPSDSPPQKRGLGAFLPGNEMNNGDVSASRARTREELARLRERLRLAAEDRPETLSDLALADTIHRFGLDVDDLRDVITGVEMDLDSRAFRTFDDLRTYCYYVASAVGLATLPILNDGVPPTDAMRERAVVLGLGMQLVNILRDVAEDLDRGRVYLPADELARCDVTQEDLERGVMTDRVRSLLGFQADRARRFIDEGRELIPLVPRRSRGCLWLLAELYGRVLARIVAADYDLFHGSASLPAREKLALLALTLWRRL